MARRAAKYREAPPARVERLGFRLDQQTKELIERAAHLQRRKVTEFCLTALAEVARQNDRGT